MCVIISYFFEYELCQRASVVEILNTPQHDSSGGGKFQYLVVLKAKKRYLVVEGTQVEGVHEVQFMLLVIEFCEVYGTHPCEDVRTLSSFGRSIFLVPA